MFGIKIRKQRNSGLVHNHNKQHDEGTFLCDLCAESMHKKDSFYVKGCTHFYCHQCIVKFVVSKLENNVTSIKCPERGCMGVLEPDPCRRVLPEDVFSRWGIALCEKVIMESKTDEYFYCPFKGCSALLIHENGIKLRQCLCPYCKRELCADCRVPWHTEFDCAEFQLLMRKKGGQDDQMVEELAKQKNWRRCPSCKYYVEKAEGCNHVICRCGYHLFYECEAPSNSHTGTSCPKPSTPPSTSRGSDENGAFTVCAVVMLITVLGSILYCLRKSSRL